MCGGGGARGNLDLHYLISHSGHTLTRDHVSQTLNKYWGKEKQNILWPHFSAGVSNGRMTGDDKEPDDICSWGGSWMTEWHPPCGWCWAFQARSHMLAGLMLGLTWTRPHHQVRGHQGVKLLYTTIVQFYSRSYRVHSLYTVTLFKTKCKDDTANAIQTFEDKDIIILISVVEMLRQFDMNIQQGSKTHYCLSLQREFLLVTFIN